MKCWSLSKNKSDTSGGLFGRVCVCVDICVRTLKLYSLWLSFDADQLCVSVSRFLPALLTAVLTNHLAWVPTVMPNGQPPIKIFLEKHSSQSVDLLAKTHPYNPLWAQLGEQEAQ